MPKDRAGPFVKRIATYMVAALLLAFALVAMSSTSPAVNASDIVIASLGGAPHVGDAVLGGALGADMLEMRVTDVAEPSAGAPMTIATAYLGEGASGGRYAGSAPMSARVVELYLMGDDTYGVGVGERGDLEWRRAAF